jgi:hypothetical protein
MCGKPLKFLYMHVRLALGDNLFLFKYGREIKGRIYLNRGERSREEVDFLVRI